MLFHLKLRDLLLPVCVQDIAVATREALIDLRRVSQRRIALWDGNSYVLPCAGEQLRVGGMAVRSDLGARVSVGDGSSSKPADGECTVPGAGVSMEFGSYVRWRTRLDVLGQ